MKTVFHDEVNPKFNAVYLSQSKQSTNSTDCERIFEDIPWVNDQQK